MTYPIEGSCQCGGVKYRLLKEPMMVIACHCKECQKLSTSAFSITAMVNASDVEFEGEMAEWSRLADSGNTSAAKFCPTCGNRIYHFSTRCFHSRRTDRRAHDAAVDPGRLSGARPRGRVGDAR